MSADAVRLRTERLLWLDITRVLSAVMILGFHWLRPGYKLGLFGQSGYNLIVSYQTNTSGVQLFHDVFIAGFQPTLEIWLTNLIGILGGFGWEAVSALVLVSGFSLVISQRNKSLTTSDWIAWLRKRAVRILVPFYLIALPCLTAAACALLVLHYNHSPIAGILMDKVHEQIQTSVLGLAFSHILLFNPFARQWTASFFVPAWWFIPAILLAYLTYPFVRRASKVARGIPLLLVSAAITIVATIGSNAGVLYDESWYFIVLHLSFDFSLGVVLGNIWLGEGRAVLERALDNWLTLLFALAVFILGQLANWSPETRVVANMLFGPSLVVILVYLSRRLEKWRHAEKLVMVDPYDLYLVHQPFAFPIALASKYLFHGYAIFIGWFVFLTIAAFAASILTYVQQTVFVLMKPVARTSRRVPSEQAS